MSWIVLTVLAAIAFWVGFGCFLYGRKQEAVYKARKEADPYASDSPPMWGFGGLVTMVVAVGLWIAITGFMMVKTVGEREVGIVYNFTGTIAGKREKGWVTIAPWQHMEKENIAIQHKEFVFDQNNSAVSKDQQDIFANLAINYSIDADKVLDLYRRVGPSWESTIVESRVPQVFKEVTSTFPTPRITEERVALREQTRGRLQEELKPYDIDVVDVFITNLGFSDLYSAAIEEKQKQVQDAQRAQARVAQVEAEARQKVAEAEGAAKANIALASGEAKANRLRSRSLTPSILKLRAIETLNDNVQVIICPPQSVCIPNSGIIPNPARP